MKNKKLLICLTPLQMLIAEKIIESNKNDIFDLVVLALKDTDKYKKYYSRLSVKCERSIYCKIKPGFWGFIYFYNFLKKNKFINNYRGLYLASIDSRYVQYFVSKNHKANVYTFDDGTANIVKSSIYYKPENISSFKKTILKFIGISDFKDDIIKKSLLHYTIYDNVSNIINNTKYIPLVSDYISKEGGVIKNIKIYLGQPLLEINSNFDFEYLVKEIEKIKFDFYFPHPREDFDDDLNFNVIKTDLIFEDFIIKYLEDNPNVFVEIYSFTSSALINVKSLKRVKCFYIYNEDFMKYFKDFYFASEKIFNIELINLESI